MLFDQQIPTVGCRKCGYVRKPADTGPAYACPTCGAVYAKVEQALRIATGGDAPVRLRKVTESRNDFSWHYLMAHLIYLLYVLPVGGIWWARELALDMAERDCEDWIASHFDWQVRLWERFDKFFSIGAGIGLFLVIALGYGVFFGQKDFALAVGVTFEATFLLAIPLGLIVFMFVARIFKGWVYLFLRKAVE